MYTMQIQCNTVTRHWTRQLLLLLLLMMMMMMMSMLISLIWMLLIAHKQHAQTINKTDMLDTLATIYVL